MMLRTTFVAVVVMLGACKDAPPRTLGPVAPKLSAWQRDCPAPLVEETVQKGPDPMMIGRRKLDEVFQMASTRYVCPLPGWSLYADSKGELVGFCVDDTVLPRETHLSRAKRLLANHFPTPFVADITAGECSYEPKQVGHGLRRWEQELTLVPAPDGGRDFHPPAGTLEACCWEATR